MNSNTCCDQKQRSGALHVTQKVDYGIILLATLAKSKTSRSIQMVANEHKLSFPFLQKIARLLKNSGLIKAERGKLGGYTLTKSPDKLGIKEIIEALEGEIAIVPCLKKSEKPLCRHIPYCLVRPSFQKINAEIQQTLLSKTLTYFI